ncbi:MAG: hypothetical protein PHP35_02335 [Candidatus Colwellbacteria bacterium]|nr:hypothetical protein [Candidatus Colwellbacteria bacterium]
MDKIIAKIKTLKGIVPNADFAIVSRSTIITTPRKQEIRPFRSFVYEIGISVGVMATAVIFAIIIGNIKSPGAIVAVTDLKIVEDEASAAANDIDIVLQEIGSFDKSAKRTSLALGEVAGNGPAHLNESILSSEIEDLDIAPSSNDTVDSLLDQAIF